ncbi:MAG: hypothetical protein HFH84_05520 [Lachnospiraceae bacterium]|jgi:hypothetical protein|nr:hypothetical protein [Lachnospiraceae bacterium]
MDINGIGGSGVLNDGTMFSDLPVGFGMALAMNEAAMSGYAGLTEAEKEKIILRCKDARTKGQMQEIVDSLAPGTDIQEVIEEEKEQFL